MNSTVVSVTRCTIIPCAFESQGPWSKPFAIALCSRGVWLKPNRQRGVGGLKKTLKGPVFCFAALSASWAASSKLFSDPFDVGRKESVTHAAASVGKTTHFLVIQI